MGKRNPRRSVAEWNDIVTDFHQSGLSIQAYCNQNQLALATFSKWKRRIAQSELVPTTDKAPAFVPLVRADPVSPPINSSINLQIGPSITLSISVTGATHEQ